MNKPSFIVVEYGYAPITEIADVEGLAEVDWSQVTDYYVKWGTLYLNYADGTRDTFDLPEEDVSDNIDWKSPLFVGMYDKDRKEIVDPTVPTSDEDKLVWAVEDLCPGVLAEHDADGQLVFYTGKYPDREGRFEGTDGYVPFGEEDTKCLLDPSVYRTSDWKVIEAWWAAGNRDVYIEHTDETGEWAYAVNMRNDPGFWLDTFDTEDAAMAWVAANGLSLEEKDDE